MDHNLFRDYCKAENTDDEEANVDLQSRLYAEIYYGPSNIENIDVKPAIKSEIVTTASDTLQRNESITTTPNPNDSLKNINSGTNERCSGNSSTVIENDNKANIKPIVTTSQTEPLHGNTNSQSNLSIPSTKIVQHSIGNVSIKKNVDSTILNTENAESSLDLQNVKQERNVAEPEIETESKEQLSLKRLNPETPVTQSPSTSAKAKQEVTNTENELNENDDNILMKYEFSKLFINKLYLKKYIELEKKLQEMEEEKIDRLKEEQRKEDEQQGQVESIVDEADTDSRYMVQASQDKSKKTPDCYEEIVLSSEGESESEDSILEVPIPPKPQPPVINLHDSDDGSDSSSSSDDESDPFIADYKNVPLKNTDGKRKNKKSPDINTATEDIMINCTEVQACASSINEIKEASKSAQSVTNPNQSKRLDILYYPFSDEEDTHNVHVPSNTTAHSNVVYERDKNLPINFADDIPLSNSVNSIEPSSSNKRRRRESDNEAGEKSVEKGTTGNENKRSKISPEKSVNNDQSNTTAHSNVVYERDKNLPINFADDIPLSNFVNSIEPSSSNKRRRRESDNEAGEKSVEKGTTGNENKRSKISPEKSVNNDQNEKQTWEEYFFRPLPDKVKAFYNESRGQENFDIREIQNNMSKDPRLWTILDEDLMPELARQHRYWNTKCNYCQFEGHKRRNCPELLKPPRCHMCGNEGHTETRCPGKMCLTCGKKQGTFRKTCESCRVLYCNMCNAVGHKSAECPDHWRRFHQTTQNSDINVPDNLSEVMKPADLLYCCNCAKRGHDSSTCNEYRWSQHFPTPAYVSNYTDGTRNENSAPATSSKSTDIIPLDTKKKKHKCRIFIQGQDNLDGCFVVYSFGAFYTKEPNGEEVKRKLLGDQIYASHLTNFLKGRITPLFLDQLKKLVKFEIKLYYDSQRSLIVRIRSLADIAPRICEIFVFWLKMSDEDKHLQINTDLPLGKRKMIKFLKAKLDSMDKGLDDPQYLYDQIELLKSGISDIHDPTRLTCISDRIVYFREKLIRVFHLKPKCSHELYKLKQYLKFLNRSPLPYIDLTMYLNILYVYNKIFLPRTLTEKEFNRFLTKCEKAMNKEKSKKNEERNKKKDEAKRQQKSQLNPYEAFLQNLRKCNEMENNKNADDVDNRDAAQSTSTAQTSTVVSADVHDSVVNNIEDGNVRDTGNNSTENSNKEANVDESNSGYPVKSTQLPCNKNVSSNNNELTDTVTNYSTLPILTRSSSNHTPALQSDHIPSSQIEDPRSKEETFSEATSSKVAAASNSKESAEKKKKKKKRKREKTNVQDISPAPEVHATEIDPSLVSFAERLKDEALSFNLPHMNKAVEEIQKRIADKNLRQEHIDVLQKLINLEKDHQIYVSSFCNYLQ